MIHEAESCQLKQCKINNNIDLLTDKEDESGQVKVRQRWFCELKLHEI